MVLVVDETHTAQFPVVAELTAALYPGSFREMTGIVRACLDGSKSSNNTRSITSHNCSRTLIAARGGRAHLRGALNFTEQPVACSGSSFRISG